MRHWRRPEDDQVTPELHREVILRDGECFLFRLDPETHFCADRFGSRHAPDNLAKLTVDHFHLHAGGTKGQRARSDKYHLVAMCGAGNVGCPSALVRQMERDYIFGKYPELCSEEAA